ncbi:MAG TPA: hypothetical protein PKL06_10645 [Chitinophagales bacterium]|nr:hypothetical protein [Chitinophagales bacterium]
MKKVTYFAFALMLTGFVACKGDKAETEETPETTTTTVETGASESVDNAAEQVDEVLNQESEDELLGTDVDDAAVESATKK